MTDHENKNTQHRPSTGETDQTHESGWMAAVRKRGAEFLKLTKGSLRTARMIHQHGLPLHHEAVLTHENDTQDDAPSPKTHIYYDGKLIKTQTFSQLYARMLRQKPETNQRTIVSPED